MTSHGDFIREDLKQDERYVINAEPVASWHCACVFEMVKTLFANVGHVDIKGRLLKFIGTGTVFSQTRNRGAFMSDTTYPLANYCNWT